MPTGGHRGYTLADLALTVLVMGIVAATAAPKLTNSIRYQQAEGAARRIEADINYAQAYARYANTTCSITFTTSPPSYTITGVANPNNSGQAYSVDLTAIGCPVTLSRNLNGTGSVTFTATGVPQAGSPLSALTTGTVTVTAGTRTRTVTIDPVTGKAKRS